MHILSVNVGQRTPIANAKASGITGIYKTPAAEPARVTALGLAGDFIADTEHHGGVDQAVYVYGTDDYDWWAAELGRPLAPGTFGKNLTVAGLASGELAVGDR
ncbi:MAG TPA: MOSC domain-containing protein, partial [Promineifilum sp.]|nr:MOSC domain-containing protein [Promineifilum sp.]